MEPSERAVFSCSPLIFSPEIDRHYAFFLPWAGMEKAQFIAENHADVKTADKMAKPFDVLIAHNK